MIYVIVPPFHKGANEYSLYVDFMQNVDTPHTHLIYPEREFLDVIDRETPGFYDNQKWMPILLKQAFSIIPKLKSGDAVVFIDFWNPCVPAFYAHCKINSLHVKLLGWFHGATFMFGDYLNEFFPRGGFLANELEWLRMFDQIWYASDFFVEDIKRMNLFSDKFIKVDSPFDVFDKQFKQYLGLEKRYDVIFPFRLDPDKVDLPVLEQIIKHLEEKNISILITSVRQMSEYDKKALARYKNVIVMEYVDDNQHLETLARSRVILSLAKQEGWGYTVLKAISLGCYPVLINAGVYMELYQSKFLFDSPTDAHKKILTALSEEVPDINYIFRSSRTKYTFSNYYFDEHNLLRRKNSCVE